MEDQARASNAQFADLFVSESALIAMHYLGNPSTVVAPENVGQVIADIYAAVEGHDAGEVAQTESTPAQSPAVPVEASIHQDYIVCLEDGKKLTLLKRYLQAQHGLTPEQYRAKWSLPSDYPMVAPAYAQKRSQLAKAQGLGQKPVEIKQPARRRKAG